MAKKTEPQKKRAGSGIRPLGDRVLVRPIEAVQEKTVSGIIIPDTVHKEKPERGEVVAVGEGKRSERGELIAPRVQVGDTVIFSRYGFDEVKMNGEEYYIVSEGSILAIIG